MYIGLGNDPRDFPVPEGDPEFEETMVVLKVGPKELKRLVNYFGGAPWPYDVSNAEIEDAGNAWISLQHDIKRGK